MQGGPSASLPPAPPGGGHEHCFPPRGEVEDDESQAEWRELCGCVVHEARARHFTSIGADLACLPHLELLDVSANEIDRFQAGARADALEILQCYSNKFASLTSLPNMGNLRFLGLGFNDIASLPLDLARRTPNLASLDLAFNSLRSLDDVVAALRKCRKLRQVFLAGNPCALLESYRVRLVVQLPALETVDDAEVTGAERAEYELPEGGVARGPADSVVRIEVTLKSLLGLPAPDAGDAGGSAPGSRPGTGKKAPEKGGRKSTIKKSAEVASDAPPPVPDPDDEGCYVDVLVVGAPPETKRRTARLFWRKDPANAARRAADGAGAAPPAEVVVLEVPATVALRDGIKFKGLLVSVLKATPPTAADRKSVV